MSKVVGLDGKKIEGEVVDPRKAVEALKLLVADMEAGKIAPPQKWLFIFTQPCRKHPNDPSDYERQFLASDMTVQEVCYELECFKHFVLMGGDHP